MNYARPIHVIEMLMAENSQFFHGNKIVIQIGDAYLNMLVVQFRINLLNQNKGHIKITVDGSEKWYKNLHNLLIKKGLSANIEVNPFVYTVSLSHRHQESGERHFSNNFSRRLMMIYGVSDNAAMLNTATHQVNAGDISSLINKKT